MNFPNHPNWPAARARWAAFWDRLPVDRPLVDVKAPSGKPPRPLPEARSTEDLWLGLEYVPALTQRKLETTYFGGEAIPADDIHPLMAGWILGCGANVGFAEDTIWHTPFMSSLDESEIGKWRPGPGDPWLGKVEALIDRLLDTAQGQYLVGYAYQLPLNDLLSLLRGPQALLIDLAEDVERCRCAIETLFPLWAENFDRIRRRIERHQAGCVWNWPGLWHDDFVMVTQSDMSCMISPLMFERFVAAELDLLGERYGRVWYHLDGPDAIRHLDRLLAKPYITAIQYVPGDGQPPNGPHWLDLYRRVQAAGRCLDLSVPAEHVEYLVRHLNPEGLVLRTWVDSYDKADELVADAVAWCGSHIHR